MKKRWELEDAEQDLNNLEISLREVKEWISSLERFMINFRTHIARFKDLE